MNVVQLGKTLSNVKVPLLDNQRLELAKLLSPDPLSSLWVDLDLESFRLCINLQTGELNAFTYRTTMTADDTITLKKIDQSLIDHCRNLFEKLNNVLKGDEND